MIRVALVAIALLTVLSQIASAEKPATKTEPVRKITVTVDPLAAATLPGKPGVTAVNDEKGLKGSFGEDIAKQVIGKIDFAKEDLVHVSWGSSGPPFGELQYEIKQEKDGQVVTFSIKEPNVAIRGEAYRLGNDFFAVPKKIKVRFGKELPLPIKAAPTKTSMKGWELYIGQKDGSTYFSLLEGTNRLKTDDEITKAAVKGIDAIKLQLDDLKPGEEVFVMGRKRMEPPPKNQATSVVEYGKKIGLKVQE